MVVIEFKRVEIQLLDNDLENIVEHKTAKNSYIVISDHRVCFIVSGVQCY